MEEIIIRKGKLEANLIDGMVLKAGNQGEKKRIIEKLEFTETTQIKEHKIQVKDE